MQRRQSTLTQRRVDHPDDVGQKYVDGRRTRAPGMSAPGPASRTWLVTSWWFAVSQPTCTAGTTPATMLPEREQVAVVQYGVLRSGG